MLIAVASKSGTEVDQHFGHAERFLVFECAAGQPQLVREVPVEKYCSFDPDHVFRKPQFQAIVEGLEGCRAVVTAIAAAARARRGVIVLLGGHVIKTGMGPLLARLLRRGVITHVAMNGAAAIHDVPVESAHLLVWRTRVNSTEPSYSSTFWPRRS